MKKILIGFAALLVLLLAALVAIPYFFKDEIVAQIKASANENLNAQLDFKDVDVSILRNFPQLSIGLEGLDITGVGVFEGTKLVHCERLDVAVDLMSALFGTSVVVEGLHLKKPSIHVFVLKNGQANYDIAKPDPAAPASPAAESTGGSLQLESYSIEDGQLTYDDRSLDMKCEIEGLQHEGRGDFGADIYDLVMKTRTEKLSVNYGGVQYLRNARTFWDATLTADMKNMRFTMKDNDLKINDLALTVDGWTQLPNEEDILMDLKFGTPANTFKSLLSIIPGAYTQDFSGVKANGTLQFDGFAKGKYNEKTYPAFGLNFKVGNGDFKYPSLPLGVSQINVDARINSPSTNLNAMTVDIPKFGFSIGSNPISGFFHLKTPESDPSVDTKITGTLNLGELTKAFPVEGVQELSGIFKADLALKAAMSQIEKQQYEQVNASGSLSMEGLNYRAAGTPAVKINSMALKFSPQFVDIQQFDTKLGKSDLRGSGRIDNVLAYFSTEKTMRGNLSLASNYFDANEWMTPESAAAAETGPGKVPTDPAPAPSEKVFDRWDFTTDADFKRIKYDVYDLSDVHGKGHFTPNDMDLADFGLKIGQSDLSGNGKILNAWNYLFDNQTVSGTVNLNSNYFDLNQFMTEEPATTAAAGTSSSSTPPPAEIIPVPENMDMTLNAKMAKVQYTNLTLTNVDGAVVVRDQAANLQDCTASVLGGQIGLKGEYNTKNPAKPIFNMDMALQNMGFKEAYQNFVTVKSFAPIAQYMDGQFNTTLSLSGILGKDMMPDLSTLSAAGFLETVNALVKSFKPLQAVGNYLNVDYLKNLELKNSRNWFEIKDGTVVVKPFDVQVRDMALKIGGSHGLTNDMNYQIFSKTPRKTLEKSAAGAAANSGLNFLTKEASKYGVNIAQGEFINVRFDLTGTMLNPKVAMKVLGSDGEATLQDEASAAAGAVVDKAKDSLANVAQKKLEEGKQKANEAIDKAADTLGKVANKAVEQAKNKATEAAKEKVGEVLGKEAGSKAGGAVGKAAEKTNEALGKNGQKTVENVKDKLGKWNPLNKKGN